MIILVTGATGFVGRYIVSKLLESEHEIIALTRSADKARAFPWCDHVHLVEHDIHEPMGEALKQFGAIDTVIHLAWQGLPNYKSLFHFEENLAANYNFLKALVRAGVKHLLVTGTCFEYGMQSGGLSEDCAAFPANPYALAKDTLRKFLLELRREQSFVLQWVRLFYMYGQGQNPNSLIAQLDRAIDQGDAAFNMSGGEQLRDYLPVEEVARRLVLLIEHPEVDGIINCCSGKPISVRRLVEKRIAERGAKIRLNLGHYPYPDFEPMAFWGDSHKMDALMKDSVNGSE